mgnify:CR=1 FL=1
MTTSERISSIKAKIASLRECLPYADSAQARTADQDRIRKLEKTLKELEDGEHGNPGGE